MADGHRPIVLSAVISLQRPSTSRRVSIADQHGCLIVRCGPRRDSSASRVTCALASRPVSAPAPALIEHLSAHRSTSLRRRRHHLRPPPPGHPVVGRSPPPTRATAGPDACSVGGYRTLLAVPILARGLLEAIFAAFRLRAEARAFDAKGRSSFVASFADHRRRSRDGERACSPTQRARCSGRRPGRGAGGHQQPGWADTQSAVD